MGDGGVVCDWGGGRGWVDGVWGGLIDGWVWWVVGGCNEGEREYRGGHFIGVWGERMISTLRR